MKYKKCGPNFEEKKLIVTALHTETEVGSSLN